MEWTKAEIADERRRQGEGARRRQDQRRAQPEGQAHAHRGRRAREEGGRRAAARRFPGQRARTSQRCSATSSTTRCASQVLDTGHARRRPQAERSAPDLDRHGRAAARARLGAVHARPDAGARRRHARHGQRRAAPRHRSTSRSETTKSFMLHYNFPPFSTGEVRPMRGTVAPRDRPRQPRRARAAGRAAGVRGVPVHDSHRLRHPRVERLVVDGVGVRRLARAVRRRRPDSRAPSPAWRWG